MKGALGTLQGSLGLGQFAADMLGLPPQAAPDWADRVRNNLDAIGDPGDPMSRNVENAVSGVTQVLPLMFGGELAGAAKLLPSTQIFMQTFGQSYSDGRDAGQDPTQASVRAGMLGAGAVLGHALGLGDKMRLSRRRSRAHRQPISRARFGAPLSTISRARRRRCS
ncbi:MAG: hypothetical protein WDN30_14140 [Pararobbsia sp.]